MSLSDRINEARKPPVKGPRCSVCQILDRLPADEAEVLTQALQDDTFTGTSIAKALQAEGHHMTAQTLNRHRRGDCVHQ